MPFMPASDALKSVTVLDLTRVRSGPTCVRQLADWGANVIKIESPEHLGQASAFGERDSGDFQNLQRNRRGITIDLKNPDGLKAFLRLVTQADIVVENYRADVKNRLGIDYDSLRKINPRIILGSISGFGQDGPYGGRPGFDQIAQGMGGIMSITGEPGRGPMRAGIPVADLTAGLFCSIGILTALYEREKSGEGQWVQTSLLQAMIFMLDFQAARYLMEGEIAGQAGNNHPTSIPTGVFETADGFINIAASGGNMWQRLCKVLQKEEWLTDDRFDTGTKRSDNRDILNPLIGEVTRTRKSNDWVEALTETGVPCGPIYNIGEMFDDPQVKHLGMAEAIETVPFGKTRMVAQPVKLSRTPSRLARRPAELGEHNDEVLSEFGFSADEIAALKKSQAI